MKHSQIGYVWSTIWSLNIKKVLNISFFLHGVERPKTVKDGQKRQNREWNTARSPTIEAGFPKLSLEFFYLKY